MARKIWHRLPEDPDGLTFADLKKAYVLALQRLDECKRMKSAVSSSLRDTRKDERELKDQVKRTNRQLVTLSKRQKAKEEASKAGYWSGGAAIAVTIMYEIFKVSGFPGGAEWTEFWNHEAVFGVIMWTMTMVFGQAYKSIHSNS